MNKPHKHAALIKKWADGAEIEYFMFGEWRKVYAPDWSETTVYRIKQQPVIPEISLTEDEIFRYYVDYDCGAGARRVVAATAKYVYEQSIKAAIAQGKIILMENK